MKDGKPRTYVWIDDEMQRRLNTTARRAYRSRVNWLLAHPGDTLTRLDVIHHKDEDTLNDAPDNLVKYTSQAEHARHHDGLAPTNRGRKPLPDTPCEVCGAPVRPWRRFCSVACTAKGQAGAGNPRFGKGATEHQRETQSQKMKGRTLTPEHREKLREAHARRRAQA